MHQDSCPRQHEFHWVHQHYYGLLQVPTAAEIYLGKASDFEESCHMNFDVLYVHGRMAEVQLLSVFKPSFDPD